MTESKAYQVADWNGRSGEQWVANQARLDAMLAAFGDAAIEAAAIGEGERVLDVGCGAGARGRAAGVRGEAGRAVGDDRRRRLDRHRAQLGGVEQRVFDTDSRPVRVSTSLDTNGIGVTPI